MVLGCMHVGHRALTPALGPESPPSLSAYSHCTVLLLINYANYAPEEHRVPIASSGQSERAITQPAYPCLLLICCDPDSILDADRVLTDWQAWRPGNYHQLLPGVNLRYGS